jgi:hypothetical protein
MKDELTLERWGGAKALIFSVPYSNIKILALIDKDGMRGAIYNPYLLTAPLPWLDRCHHCREGRQKHVPLKIRKLVQVLCSNKPDKPDGYRFTLPNRYRIGARLTLKGWAIRIRKPGNGATLHVVKLEGEEPIGLQESAREFRSPILLRTLKMLFSARRSNEAEVRAIMLPMQNQDLAILPPSRRTPCWRAAKH